MPRCPVCFVPMTRVEEGGVRHSECPSCFGLWIDTMAIRQRLADEIKANPAGSAPRDPNETPLADLATLVAESDAKKEQRKIL